MTDRGPLQGGGASPNDPVRRPILEARNLRKTFRTKHGPLTAVAGVSFRVSEGEIYGLVGESGSGKTTIGLMIAGMYAPDAGDMLFRGTSINAPAARRSAESKRQIPSQRKSLPT